MHLHILENYIAELTGEYLSEYYDPHNIGYSEPLIDKSKVISDLMQILVEQEKLFPDFPIDGDMIDYHQRNNLKQKLNKEENEKMKKIAWFGMTAIISSICFLIGFFSAPC